MSKDTKPYGLIMPKKAQLSAPRAGNIFGDDNDSDPDDGVDWVKRALKAESEKHKVKKQTRLNMEKALNEDPTIYQYDEVYEDIGKAKEQSKPVKEEKKKPKYIHNLLKAAERRKMEQEHRLERMVQKEREAEGELYADKESFVTSAYRAKLEQFRKIEEEEERMDRLEAIADVTKQPDMSGFHRHLFAQTFDGEKTGEVAEEKNSPGGQKSASQSPNIDRDEDLPSDSSESQSDSDDDGSRGDKNREKSKITSKRRGNRQYRKRVVEASESESEEEAQENSDNDATKETTAASALKGHANQEKNEPLQKKPKLSDPEKEEEKDTADSKNKSLEVFAVPDSKNEKEERDVKKEESKEEKKPEEKKPSIWEKRTVGPVFEAALQRYYARKTMRVSGS